MSILQWKNETKSEDAHEKDTEITGYHEITSYTPTILPAWLLLL